MLPEKEPLWLHLGCGIRVFDGFVNLDICPQDVRVTRWNLLDLWPDELEQNVEGVFSEDCLEHFFFGEQTYILCNINRALRPKSTARILMPSLSRLLETYERFSRLRSNEFLNTPYGAETAADQLNYGMRFTGHRWLHDQQSFQRIATMCGFEAIATDCTTSSVNQLSGLNLRGDDSSFANDLRKTRTISRSLLFPMNVNGATEVERPTTDAPLFVATSARPTVEYQLPQAIAADSIACLNFRSSNLSSFVYCLKTLLLDDFNADSPWYFDETLKSQPHMNIITNSQIKATIGADRTISRLAFSPAANVHEYFTVGPAEIFLLGD